MYHQLARNIVYFGDLVHRLDCAMVGWCVVPITDCWLQLNSIQSECEEKPQPKKRYNAKLATVKQHAEASSPLTNFLDNL